MPEEAVIRERAVIDAFGPADALHDLGMNYSSTDDRTALVFNYAFLKASAVGWREVRSAFNKYHGGSLAGQAVQDSQACNSLIKGTEFHAGKCLEALGAWSKNDSQQEELACILWESVKLFFVEVPDMDVFWAIVAYEVPFRSSKLSAGKLSKELSSLRASKLIEIQEAITATGSRAVYNDGSELQDLVRKASFAMGSFAECLSTGGFSKPPGDRWEIN